MGLSDSQTRDGFSAIEFHLRGWDMINMILDLEEESFSPLEWKKPPWEADGIIRFPGNQALHKQFMDGLYRK